MDTNQHESQKRNEPPKDSFVFIRVNSWFYSPDHGQLCQFIETWNTEILIMEEKFSIIDQMRRSSRSVCATG